MRATVSVSHPCSSEAFDNPLALEQRLTVGTLLPAVVDSLVATYVDVLGWEQLDGFIEYVEEELHGTFLAHAKKIATDEMLARQLMLQTCARQPRIGYYSRQYVSRELYLGNNLDVA